MHTRREVSQLDLDRYVRRGRRLRSAAAAAVFAAIGRTLVATLERALVRPYRMARTPGCCGEA